MISVLMVPDCFPYSDYLTPTVNHFPIGSGSTYTTPHSTPPLSLSLSSPLSHSSLLARSLPLTRRAGSTRGSRTQQRYPRGGSPSTRLARGTKAACSWARAATHDRRGWTAAPEGRRSRFAQVGATPPLRLRLFFSFYLGACLWPACFVRCSRQTDFSGSNALRMVLTKKKGILLPTFWTCKVSFRPRTAFKCRTSESNLRLSFFLTLPPKLLPCCSHS